MKATIDQIKEVRQRTGLGLLEVTKAFSEVSNFEDVFGTLQQRGVNIAKRRQGKTAGLRRLQTYCHHNGKYASVVGFACESDFVANSDVMKEFMEEVCQLVAIADFDGDLMKIKGDEHSIEYLLSWPTLKDASISVGQLLDNVSAKTGEKIEIFGYTQKQV